MSPATWQPSAGLPKAVSPPPGAGAGPIGPSLPVGGAGKRGVEEPPPTVDKQRVQIKRKAKVRDSQGKQCVCVFTFVQLLSGIAV